jgi:hypothetical protein
MIFDPEKAGISFVKIFAVQFIIMAIIITLLVVL